MSAAPIICLVDDDPSVLKSLGRLLAVEGYSMLSFSSPVEFIRHAAGHPVDLAVLDFTMPGLSGLQVQDCLRDLSPGTRVIMISATEDLEVGSQALAGGACAFFRKPFDHDQFLDAVRVALAPADLAG